MENGKNATQDAPKKRKKFNLYKKDNITYTAMCLPIVIKTLIFSILPLLWLLMAFENYKGFLGIFGSEWVGFANFTYFFRSKVVWKVIWNTLSLNLLFVIVGTPSTALMALLMYEMKNKFATKFFQTIYFIPYLISWTVAEYCIEGILGTNGLINTALKGVHLGTIDFYNAANGKLWPWILLLCGAWKGHGYSIIMYYASLVTIDTDLFEAAKLDGANRAQRMWYISVPHLRKIVAILLIMSMGGIFHSDFGLFWFIPKNDSLRSLLDTTEVLDTYIYQLSIRETNYSAGTAIGLIQSIVGTVILLLTNFICKKLDEDTAFI